jgi:hypothetical protein
LQCSGSTRTSPDPTDEGGEIVDFFGQLWLIPDEKSPLKTPRSRVRPGEREGATLVWIEKSKWENLTFKPGDCFPTTERDVWVEEPRKLDFAEKIWGESKKKTFIQALRSMAGRVRGGRGPRPRNLEGGWEGWGEYQYPPPFPPPHPPLYLHPPSSYDFFPNPPHPAMQHHPHRLQGFNHFQQRPKGQFQVGRGRFQQQPPPGAQQTQGKIKERPLRAPPKRKTGSPGRMRGCMQRTAMKQLEKKIGVLSDFLRYPQIICFKCGVAGHYSSACNKPKVCFICYSKDNVVDGCPEWTKPQQAAQYLGSANKGLGFYHIDVVPREGRFRHWT